MSDVSMRTIISTRYEISIPAPNAGAELLKAYTAAEHKYNEIHVRDWDAAMPSDDALTVEARDDRIVIHFTVERPADRG